MTTKVLILPEPGTEWHMVHADESVPTGMPDDDAPEPPPLGGPDPEPEESPDTGPEAQPGIPTEGEPPASG